MKKKISLFITALSLTASLSLQAAQAPLQPFGYEPQNIFHKIIGEELKISLAPEGASTQSLSIMSKPVSEDDEDMTIKMLIKAAHRSSRPFCFTLCRNADGKSAFALADDNLRPLADLPEGFIPLGKYKLYTGGKGQCFPPDFIIQQARPTVHIQQVPAPYPVHIQVPVHIPVPAPFPVFVDRVVTIPYSLRDRLNSVPPASLLVSPTPTQIEKISHEFTAPQEPAVKPLTSVIEVNEDDVALKEIERKELRKQQKKQRAEQARKDRESELGALAEQKAVKQKELMQEAATLQEQEKIRTLEAIRLKKIEETDTALRAESDKQEQAQKALEQQKKQRAEQARKDKETAAFVAIPKVSISSKKKATKALSDDNTFLEEAMKQTAAQRAEQAQKDKEADDLKMAGLETKALIAIKTACDQGDYTFAIKVLALCDKTTEWFVSTIFFLTTKLLEKKSDGDFSQLSQLVLNLLKQKEIVVLDNLKPHLLLYLSAYCDPKTCLASLGEVAYSENIITEAQWLALKIKEQFDNPDFKPCAHDKLCLHKKVTIFFAHYSKNEILRPLLATYILSLFLTQSRYPDTELKASDQPSIDQHNHYISEFFILAKHHLSSNDYTFLLTLSPQFSELKRAQLVNQEMTPCVATHALSGAALQQSLFVLASIDPTFFINFFKKFYKDVRETYQKQNSRAETKAMIEYFFKEKIINSTQIHFVFEELIQESELAIFYEVLNELMSDKQLPLLPEEEFKVLSDDISIHIGTQIKLHKGDTRPDAKIACDYLRRIQTAALKAASRPSISIKGSTSAQKP